VNWREKVVIRILLLVARFVSQNEELNKEIQTLSNHIGYGEEA
jgi:hypothetical protein